MRKSNRTVLNRMSKWQYALLLLMLLTFTFYSLPTFFGEQPSLGLHGQQRLTTQQQMLLNDKHLTPIKVIEQPERVELVFASQGEQQRAKQLLEQQGVDSAALTLEFHSNAPAWITRLGADPIRLGLDLRGGSQLLIGVDVDFVIDNQTKNLVDTLRTRFREANLRGASVVRTAQGAVAVTLPEVAEQESWLSIIKESAGTRQDQWKLTRSGNDLKLVLSEAERTLLVNNAVTQNLSILKKRINELGIVEASVVRQGQDGIRIELPGV
ncbi:TPA: protein translocase subunit SecD, partial [Aeromonas veronii]